MELGTNNKVSLDRGLVEAEQNSSCLVRRVLTGTVEEEHTGNETLKKNLIVQALAGE